MIILLYNNNIIYLFFPTAVVHSVVNKLFPTTVHPVYGFDTNRIYVSGVHVVQYKDEDCIRYRPGHSPVDESRLKWHYEMWVDGCTYPQWHHALTDLNDRRLTDKEDHLTALINQHDDTDYARSLPTWREMVIANDYETLQHVDTVLKRHMTVLTPLPSRESLA